MHLRSGEHAVEDRHPVGSEPLVNATGGEPTHGRNEGLAARAGRPRCGASTRLDALEFASVTTLPHTVDPVLRHLVCELGFGHEGDHVAFTVAAENGEQWWWLRWRGDIREVVQIDLCDGTQAAGANDDDCLLPHLHPGPHSFDTRVTQRPSRP
jgi:hypothetical protein